MRVHLIGRLKDTLTVNRHNLLYKKTFISIQEIFVEEDASETLNKLMALSSEVRSPGNEIGSSSYIAVLLKYFVAGQCSKMGDTEQAY